MIVIITFLMVIFCLGILTKRTGKKRKSPETISKSVEIGNEGEELVNNFLSDRTEGKLINNLLIKVHGTYAQIDHVFITNTGIYVIETKNYSGTIYGKEADDKWTCVYRGGVKHSLYNPVKQNNTHIARLRVLLQDENVKIIPVVIFTSESCKLKYTVNSVCTLDYFKSDYNSMIVKNITGKEKMIDIDEYYKRLIKHDLSNDKTAVENQIKFANKAKYSSYKRKA